ncbi:MAG: DNA helicase PcrA [Candidatus Poribacteria bacterium]|nr:DNA helicase PcrA [Candidatus Poribacteria bacterium]
MSLLDGLNKAQQAAVIETDGPVLILAGAGSGKTRAITYRIAHLIGEKNIAPWNILAVTFTNKAAQEMKERLTKLIGPASRDIWAKTFHASCAQILRRDIEALEGYTKSFTIFDTSDQTALMKRVMLDHQIDAARFKPRSVLEAISRAKNDMVSPQQFANAANDFVERSVAGLYDSYQKQLNANNALDFDDLILLTIRLFEENPRVLDEYQERFKYIHVDEYQDTNHSQYKLTHLLAKKHHNICVVGDDDQSIYSWRGADIRNILDFERDYPRTTVIHLSQNYRCTKTILSAAQEVVRFNRRRRPKELSTENPDGAKIRYFEAYDDRTEADFVVDTLVDIKNEKDTNYNDFAVFYRINALSRSFEDSLRRRNVPYQIVGGGKFYERAEVKDIIAYLRILVNPNDSVSLLRVINTPTRGIGSKTIEAVQAFAEQKYIPQIQAVERAREIGDIGQATRLKLVKFVEMLKSIRQDGGLTDIIEDVLNKTGYLADLKQKGTIEDEGRIENLNEFLAAASDYERTSDNPTLDGFLETITLSADVDNFDEEQSSVTLMTLLSAKGLEFPVVFLAGMEEGMFPHQRSLNNETELEEERRLCYVGMTRAMKDLYITRARVRRFHGNVQETLKSRFMDEIPAEFVEELESFDHQDFYSTSSIQWNKSTGSTGNSGSFKRFEQSASASRPATPRGTSASPNPQPTRRRSVSTFDAAPQDMSEGAEHIRMNARVAHAKFGAGKIVGLEGNGDNLRITVKFDDGSQKALLAAFAKLEPAT